jgi:hypothetical protein
LLVALFYYSPNGFSSVATKLPKEALEKIAKNAAKELAQKELREAQKRVAGKLGPLAEDVIRRCAKRVAKDGDELLKFAAKHTDDFSKLIRAGDEVALDMVARNGEAGRFLISRFYGMTNFKAGSPWFMREADEAIQSAWALVSPGRADGSWAKLRNSLTKAGLNGPERDFCEDLFANRVKAGRVPGCKFDSFVDGHMPGKRSGLDFIGIDKRSGRPTIVEFGTGKKPDFNNPEQMTDSWVKRHWNDYIQDPSNRTILRENGINPSLLDPAYISSEGFDFSKHFSKIICSPDISLSAAKELGAVALKLP